MTDAPWWIEDYETNIIHLWSDSDDYYGVCGATFETHGIAHSRWDMEPEKVRELSGPDFETVCAECCHQAICDWSQ